MELAVGEVLEGKVSGLTNYGAFVTLPGGRSGLVHISEVANSFVTNVHDYVQVGQSVRVRVMSVTEAGKINLSIKRAGDPPAPAGQSHARPQGAPQSQPRRSAPLPPPAGRSDNQEFEDRLKKFMQESDSRIAGSRVYSEHKSRRRGR